MEKAKALLKEAGISPGFKLTLSTPAIPLFKQINQLVAEQLKDIGLDVTLESVAASDYYAKIRSRITSFTPVRWTQRADPDGLYYTLFHPNGRGHTTGYQNEEVFELLEDGRQVYDQSERKEIYFRVQEILAEDLPVWPLLFMREYAAIRDDVKNFEWVPDPVPRYAYLWKE